MEKQQDEDGDATVAQTGSAPPPQRWVQRLKAGEVLFKEGDVDERVFVLLDGRVEICREGERIAEVGVSETFIGEVSALTGKPRWAMARTMEDSTLLVVERVESLFRADVSWALRLAKVLAVRFDRTNERIGRLRSLLETMREREGDGDPLVETLEIALEDRKQSV